MIKQTASRDKTELRCKRAPQACKISLWLFSQLLVLLACCVLSTPAQQLAIRRYDISDGLAHNTVIAIHQDKQGYIWFGTFEGLSRFDGYRFVNYGVADGLGHMLITDIIEDRRGRLWVATNGGGVARLIDAEAQMAARAPHRKFISFKVGATLNANKVNRILFDANDDLWCATDAGIYRSRGGGDALEFEEVIRRGAVNAVLEDRRGRLWFGVDNELIEVHGQQMINHGRVGVSEHALITDIIEDRQGKLLICSYMGLFEFTPPSNPSARSVWLQPAIKLNPTARVHALLEDAAGALWLGADRGLIKYRGSKQMRYTTAQGLGGNPVRALATDRDGNLWVGTEGGGAGKIGGAAMVSYTQANGLPSSAVAQVLEDNEGRLWAVMGANGLLAEINTVHPRLISQLDYPQLDAASTLIFSGNTGAWGWMSQSKPWVAALLTKPVWQSRGGRKIDLTGLGLSEAASSYFLFYEDEAEQLWFSKHEGPRPVDEGRIYRADLARAGPLSVESFPADFTWGGASQRLMISDGAGGLWLGKQERLARLWQGRFVSVTPTDGLPETDPRCFFRDSRGWLWIGMRYGGVSMTREPGAEHPHFINYSIKQNGQGEQGLSSNAVWSIVEDDFGRLYFGTDKGLDQFDPRTDRWRRYSRKDGLVNDTIIHLHKDRRGCIWVSTTYGLTRFDPRAERTAQHPAPIYFSRVNIAGEDLPLPETGAINLPMLELPASRNNLAIEFVGLQFASEDTLTYQYRLEGVDANWGAPGKTRAVNYARLAPGAYRFQARTINQEGILSDVPVTFAFRILSPVYLRWWFLVLSGLTVGLAVYGFYRYRLARLVEIERVRTRIATDLHDDIGASLSRVAILSEVVKRQAGSKAAPLLAEIADSARGLVESMREIVWAIDPRHDDLGNLVVRVRQFASDVLEARGVDWDFQVTPGLEQIKLDPEQRRHLFLIFKEAINNVARHANPGCVQLSLAATRHELRGEICDDGCGFVTVQPPQAIAHGQGLDNMHQRAAQLGGQVVVISAPGHGTSIKLTIPLKRR
ncbi:MAG: two-component regulator propeller domain-containing protein [Acidobacteriota bacterium]